MADNAFLHLNRLRQAGRKAVLATVVKTAGPTYRGPGASAVIADDGSIVGAISGGCLESDMVEAAVKVCAGGVPRLLTYNTAGPDDLLWGTGSGCGGLQHILLAPVEDDLLSQITARLNDGESVVVETVTTPGPDLGRRTLGQPGEQTGCWYRDEFFCQRVEPPVTLLVCGAGNDARPLVRYAADAGFRVIVLDHRPAWVSHDRFPEADRVIICEDGAALPTQLALPPGSYAVLITHHFERDLSHLHTLLDRPLAYIGLLGARERTARLVKQLLIDRPDLYPAIRARLHAPVGLDIGADGPQEIALAIAAELVAHRAGRPGTPLSQVHL